MEYLDENDLNIYTDGSSYASPRRGGIGILFVTVDDEGNERTDEYPLPGYDGATNNQAELEACIEALRAITKRRPFIDPAPFRRIVIRTDSKYVVENYSHALYEWQSNKWMKRDGNPVANAQQWEELIKLIFRAGKRVEIRWVKGHRKSAHNKTADKLAKESAAQRSGQRLSIVKVRRKKSDRSVEPGSVAMRGQRMTIRIVTDEFLRTQRMNKYKYEVMSARSEFRGCIDVIYSEPGIHLSAGHTYYVQVNAEPRRPRVVKMFREIVPV
ncbi:MAG: ribonuclease H [Solirubrobacteraceae bacterium]